MTHGTFSTLNFTCLYEQFPSLLYCKPLNVNWVKRVKLETNELDFSTYSSKQLQTLLQNPKSVS